tara:strand:+ start:160 stop:408 length:249 start_codon:yes stop_codon:yes gene_type:complete
MTGRPASKIECRAYARTTGLPCRAKAFPNGKCRMHGGLSTGAKTIEGKLIAWSNLRNVSNKLTNPEYLNKLTENTYEETSKR